MDISIPDGVQFYTESHRSGQWDWQDYCFAHAVLRALEGEQIKTKLMSDFPNCDDCKNFGSPRSHDLGKLRIQN